ncbi:MAG: M20/M25/M40 family metallo-hydrolase [Actinobacteria bacterium]|jgi:glutamate carboxypeptidase|nr:M20/M25/M40 family metallo-hydrolase [Actinomycetota bacterium]
MAISDPLTSAAPTHAQLRASLDARTPEMLAHIQQFVDLESPSAEVDDLQRSAEFLAAVMTDVLGTPPEIIPGEKGPHVHWKGSDDTKVLFVGHHDTVFPKGTVARRGFSVDGDIARGPGIFDMKAGIIQAIYGLSEIRERAHVEMLISSDEEIGSYTSRALIEARAVATGNVLVLEPSGNDDALKIARKGVGTFTVDIVGRASHAGLEPEKGINALMELAAQVQAIAAIAKPEVGTTVTPTVATAGTTENVVPAAAQIIVDTRINLPEEKQRVENAFAALMPTVDGAALTVRGSINRPPMHESAATALYAVAQRVAPEVGITDLRGIAVGGGSDGNFTAAIGVPTLDGLGACGGGAHADTEYIKVSKLGERAALNAAIARELVNR